MTAWNYQEQSFTDWLTQNPKGSYRQYLEEKAKLIDLDLQLYAYIHHVLKQPCEEKINSLKEEKEWFLSKIDKIKRAEKTIEIMKW